MIRIPFSATVLRILSAAIAFASCVGFATGQQPNAPPSSPRQTLEDAWWTGPLLANSANTLPRGHFLVEPYLYDVISPHTHAFGSRAYVEYGLANKFTVGIIPIVGSVFAFWFTANTRNYDLLREHLDTPNRSTKTDRIFVGAILALVVVVILAGIVGTFLILQVIAKLISV